MSRAYHHWVPSEIALLHTGTDHENAALLNLPFEAVKSKRHTMGISNRPERPRPVDRTARIMELVNRIEHLRRYA